MHLLRYHHAPAIPTSDPNTKSFQRPYLHRLLSDWVRETDSVADVGAHRYFDFLTKSGARAQAVIDPYNGAGGAGLNEVPALPYPIALYRCLLGIDSYIIPSAAFDVTFSCSVIEHIGQAESRFDCRPTGTPPVEQERVRDAFCAELYRVTKPGGITLHTVDHAARNLSFRRNFLTAGFEDYPFQGEPEATEAEALDGAGIVRQRVDWRDMQKPMPPAEQRLHGVVVMRFHRPT